MKKKIVDLVYILDKSGSMRGMEDDVIGGFNSIIEDHRKKDDVETRVTVVTFNDYSKIVMFREKMKNVREMDRDDYIPHGSTSLLDAIGETIDNFISLNKYKKETTKTIFMIMTDGEENSSRRYSYESVKDLISITREKNDFDYVFLGANIDAVAEAARFGLDRTRAANYDYSKAGVRRSFNAINDVCCCMMQSKPITEEWKKKLREADDEELENIEKQIIESMKKR